MTNEQILEALRACVTSADIHFLYGFTSSQAKTAINNGTFPKEVKRYGTMRLFLKSEVEAYLKSNDKMRVKWGK